MNKFLIKIKELKNYIYNFLKINPHRHWDILLKTFLFIIILLILASFIILYRIKNDKIFQIEIEKSEVKSLLNDKLLETTLETFNNKKNRELEIKSNPTQYTDPSI